MDKFREMMKDNAFIRGSFFIIFNAALLYVMFAAIKNFGAISKYLLHFLDVLVDAFWPLIIGLVLAYLLNPLSDMIDDKLISRLIKSTDNPVKAAKRENAGHLISVLLTVILVIAAVIALIYGFTVLIIGKVVFNDFSALIDSFMAAVTSYEDTFRHWIATNIPDGMLSEKLSEIANYIIGWIADNISVSNVINTFSNIGGNVIDIVIGIIISIYLMKDKKFFLGLWRKFLHLTLPQKPNAIITETLSEVNSVFSKFIRGALLDALIIAVLSSIGLSIMGLQAAIFIGIFAGICNVIPYFGPIIGMIPAFLMGLFTEGFWEGALAVIILFVIQQIDANLIYPKIVGSSTGLHPLIVLLAVSVFGYFGGILGMLLAVPLAGIIQVFVVKWAVNKESKLAKATEVTRTDGSAPGSKTATNTDESSQGCKAAANTDENPQCCKAAANTDENPQSCKTSANTDESSQGCKTDANTDESFQI